MRFLTVAKLFRLIDRNVTMFFLLTVAGFIGGLFAASRSPNLDNAWLLVATGRFMDGAVIGRDLVEVNPPLIYWILAPAVWLSRWLGSDYYTTYCLWVGLLAALSCFLIFKALTQIGIRAGRARLAAFAGLALLY